MWPKTKSFHINKLTFFFKNVEPWEDLKTEADMEYYEWNNNASKKSIEALFQKPAEDIPYVEEYSAAVTNLMNEGIYSSEIRK